MAAQCLPVLQFDAIRVTRLNSCGTPVDSTCAYATSTGVITLAMTNQNQERQEYLQLNGQGDICVDETKEPQLRWIEYELTLCSVDPELFNVMTSEALVLNDAVAPLAIGFDMTQAGPLTSYVAIEMWTNTGGSSCDDGVADYGYFILPFTIGAQVSDLTLENGNINFTITGRTKRNALWGTGPYNVRLIEAVLDSGEPAPLLTAIGATVHRRQFWTELPPPAGLCGCQDLTPTVLVSPLPGLAAVPRVMTFPVDAAGAPLLPAYVDWGDASPSVLVTAGTTLNHSYIIGTYTATFRTLQYSAPTWRSGSIVVT